MERWMEVKKKDKDGEEKDYKAKESLPTRFT